MTAQQLVERDATVHYDVRTGRLVQTSLASDEDKSTCLFSI